MSLLDGENEVFRTKKTGNILLIIGIVALMFFGALAYFFILPKHGDEIAAPKGLENAIRNKLKSEGKLKEITKMAYYHCNETSLGNFHKKEAATVVLIEMPKFEMVEDNIGGYKMDMPRINNNSDYTVVATEDSNAPDGWNVIAFPFPKKRSDKVITPCVLY